MRPSEQRSMLEFLVNYPHLSVATYDELAKQPHRFSEDIGRYALVQQLDEVAPDALSGETSLCALGPTALRIISGCVDEFQWDHYVIAEAVQHEGRWLLWQRHELHDALGPNWREAFTLHRRALRQGLPPHPQRLVYLELRSDQVANKAPHRALSRYFDPDGTGYTYGGDYALGGGWFESECAAVLARHLIGTTADWTQDAYDAITAPYRLACGPVHPLDKDDPDKLASWFSPAAQAFLKERV